MASPGFGKVTARHFEQLEPNLRADRAMRMGLSAMYETGDAVAAVRLFRETLRVRADHYGATFQLARALDRTGDSTAATVVWKRMLELATAQHDEATVKTVRSRLGLP
jgi:cytochrome c-type biogenesis protein CcmH/NrfG